MTVCKFFSQGNCRFGDRCKFEHPGAGQGSGFATQNRFGVFQSPANQNNARSSSPFGGRKDPLYNLNSSDIRNDLTAGKGRPQWILSSYGPGKNIPLSLLDGNELSFEELRLRYYELASTGNEQQALQEANGLWAKADSDMKNVVDNTEAAIKYIEDGDKTHPNRHDICSQTGDSTPHERANDTGQSSGFGPRSQPGAFGQSTTNSAFGQPSTFGQQSQSRGFGQPSFGQHSNPSGTPQPTFGAPNSGLSGGTFGKPSAFGPPSQPTPAFGQPAHASAFGQPSQPTGFGQPATTSTNIPFNGGQQPTSIFGQPSNPSTGFGQPTFGQSSQPTAFGQQPQPSAQAAPAFGSTPLTQSTKPFSQSPQAAPAFGAPPTASPAPTFGQPTASSASSSNHFQSRQQSSTSNAPLATSTTSVTDSSAKHAPMTYAQTLPPGSTSRDASGRLTTFRGRRVRYTDGVPHYDRPDRQGWERIWFPDGAPHVLAKEVEGLPEQYTDATRQQWKYVLEHGDFKDGKMPEVPPLREWASCDF